MYGRPFLLQIFPSSSNLSPLADHIPIFSFHRHLLYQHADLGLSQPFNGKTPDPPLSPGVLICIKFSKAAGLGIQLTWNKSHLVYLTTPTMVKVTRFPRWFHIMQVKRYRPLLNNLDPEHREAIMWTASHLSPLPMPQKRKHSHRIQLTDALLASLVLGSIFFHGQHLYNRLFDTFSWKFNAIHWIIVIALFILTALLFIVLNYLGKHDLYFSLDARPHYTNSTSTPPRKI